MQNLLGREYFNLYPYLLFVSAKKKSGKTSLIYNIIKNTTNKNTKFFIFCSTYNVDKSWIEILKYLNKRGNITECFGTIKESKDINNLDIIIDALTGSNDEGDDDMGDDDMGGVNINFGTVPVVRKKKKKKKKNKVMKIVPEYFFIFDDISNQLRNPSISRLLKIHRHLGAGCNVILSSQYVKDIQPQSIAQIDYFITFKNFSEDRLRHIHKVLDLSIDFEDYLQLYHFATATAYSFLYTNTRDESMRKGFSTQLLL